ncbi:G-type lectin S-receptor-like serine/threonine-protein kinase At4g11900 [Malus domestica]|uniref:G-type lectin S-receptor-like serine/threonine-protein kinase At4g11900 n=1 Tax=Malus domestica TaxID=3750 RepID=UPI003976EF28
MGLRVVDSIERRIEIFCDNNAAIVFSKNSKGSTATRKISYCSREDPLKKPIPVVVFKKHVAKMDINDWHSGTNMWHDAHSKICSKRNPEEQYTFAVCSWWNDVGFMMEDLNSVSLVRLVLRTITWEFGSKMSRLEILFGLQTDANPTMILKQHRCENSGTYLWQSFDYPSDTWLPGMKLGWDLRTGLKQLLSSWKDSEDPSPGDFTYGIETKLQAYPEAYI